MRPTENRQTDKARGSAVVWRHAEQLGRPRAGPSTLAAEVPREYLQGRAKLMELS